MGKEKLKPGVVLALLDKYLDGSASIQEKEIIDSWFDQHSLDLISTNRVGSKEVENRVWQAIQKRINNSNK
ncbi:hypothetical protein GCM10028803_02580 [Larkinella knui]|uniref:Uncharacterized protein n=1 Tax=Larkinella knui TaxID=2025310 RepID=A0A3P1CL30_9BACT|nr:hypothetical protein [Larkinella knui]RRB14041.1 hypothetical protein EHT87_17515 [Larkinella knui]